MLRPTRSATEDFPYLVARMPWSALPHSSYDNLVRGLAIVTAFMAREVVVLLWSCVVRNGSPIATVEAQSAKLHANVAILSPELTPAIADNPILALLGVGAPANHRDDMVHIAFHACGDASLVVQKRACIDSASDRTPVEDLFHHGVRAT